MSTQHTPGPWHIDRYGKHPRAVWGATNALPVAIIHSDGTSSAANDANGRLIAAAPELLDSLIQMLDAYEIPSVRQKARAAIAKATGETS